MSDGNELDGAGSRDLFDRLGRLRGAGELGLVSVLLGAAVLAALLTAGGPIWGLIAGGQ
jgi:hypothetical protein